METLENENRSDTANESAEKSLDQKKKKLRKDIQELKELNLQIEWSLNIAKFRDIRHLLKPPEEDLHCTSKKIPNVETQYMEELCKLTGIHCTKFAKDEYVFSFLSPGNFIGKDVYAVQIMNASTAPKVGKWVMPKSMDIANLYLPETPLENVVDLKPFLVSCKHQIDCYTNRVQQYNDLKVVVAELSGCWLDSRLGLTTITLKFFGVEILESGESHDIILYLIYKPDRVRPHKIKIDPLNSKTLTDAEQIGLRDYFKYFKSHDLKQAFQKTLDVKDTPVLWKQGEDADALGFSDGSTSSSSAVMRTVRRKTRKSPNSRGKKRKVAETSLRSQVSEDQEQSLDYLNSEQMDDSGERLIDSGDRGAERPLKSKAKRRKTTKSKAIPAAKASSAPKSSKKQSEQKKTPLKNVVEPNANSSIRNLRQSRIEFQVQRPEEIDRVNLGTEDEPLIHRIIPPVDENTTKQKSKTNTTLMGNREFRTSTPVSHFGRIKSRFVNESSEMSPIPSKHNIYIQKKKLVKPK